MGNSLGSQLSSSRYFTGILKLNSDLFTNIYLKREKSPQSALETILTTKVNFYRDTSIIWYKYVKCMFLPVI